MTATLLLSARWQKVAETCTFCGLANFQALQNYRRNVLMAEIKISL
jgi:biotin synthase-like enzyme